MIFERTRENGTSLVETVIAVVILSVVGLVIFNSLGSQQKINTKVSDKSLAFTALTTAANIITAQPFRACGGSDYVPYQGLNLPQGIETNVAVSWMAADKTWKSCSVSAVGAPTIQKVVVTFNDGTRVLKRTVLKMFPATPTYYSGGYKVQIQNKSAYEKILGPLTTTAIRGSVTLSTTGGTETAYTCYFVHGNPSITKPDGTPVSAIPSLSFPDNGACASSLTLSIDASGITSGTYSYDIAAFNTKTGLFAYPASLTVTVKPVMRIEWTTQQKSGGNWAATAQTCSNFSATSKTSSYCIVTVKVVSGTGTGQGPKLEFYTVQAGGTTFSTTVQTGISWSYGTAADAESTVPTTLLATQPANATAGRLFLYKGTGTGLTPVFCVSPNNTTPKIVLKVSDRGDPLTYYYLGTDGSLPASLVSAYTVTCV